MSESTVKRRRGAPREASRAAAGAEVSTAQFNPLNSPLDGDGVENSQKKEESGAEESSSKANSSPVREVQRRSTRRTWAQEGEESAHGGFRCFHRLCDWVSDSRASRNFHMRTEHPGFKFDQAGDSGLAPQPHSPTFKPAAERKSALNRRTKTSNVTSKQFPEQTEEHTVNVDVKEEEYKAILENSKMMDDIMEDMEEEESDSDMYEGDNEPEYVRSSSEAEEEDIFVEGAEKPQNEQTHLIKRPRGRPKKQPGDEPGPRSRLRIGNSEGKYACYVEGCDWKGLYRSIRSAHIKAMHKDWERPPRFVLNRISRHGVMLPASRMPRFRCPIESCSWMGNYRASRSAHMKAAHKEYQAEKKRALPGGYVENGRYACHVPTCDWRGASRSTRSQHIRREHENFVNNVYSARNVPCCDCPVSLMSHKLFVDHMVFEHNVGGIVQREFTDPREYEDWFDAVQDSFSIDFIKRMGVKHTAQYQVLYLYCAKGGGYRDPRAHRYNQNAIIPSRFPSKKGKWNGRASNPKCGKNCAAFLRVLNWVDGRLTVIGCVEHTGHRMGTPLLRLGHQERSVMDEYLYLLDTAASLENVLDRLREKEGFVADGYEAAPKSMREVKKFIKIQENEMESLKELLDTNLLRENTFHVELPTDGKRNGDTFTFGIMTEGMRELYRRFSSRAVCIEEVRLILSGWDLHIFLVLVFDQSDTPRCAAVYLTQSQDRLPLFLQLQQVSPDPPQTIVTDCSPAYEAIIQQIWPDEADNIEQQLAEWHLLSEWAAVCDQLVGNRVDRFTIMCALRRWIRSTEGIYFDAIMQELFDALREMELTELADFLDNQVTDVAFAKRWSPMSRTNPLTEHCNPILEIACRVIREKFLSCEMCQRIDEYIGLVVERVEEFNKCQVGAVYTLQEQDPPRPLHSSHWEDEQRFMALAEEDELAMQIHSQNVLIKRIKEDDMEEEFINAEELEEEELVVEEEAAVLHRMRMRAERRNEIHHNNYPPAKMRRLEEVEEELVEEVVEFDHEVDGELTEGEAEHEVGGELPEAGAECEVGGELPEGAAEHEVGGELPEAGAECEVGGELPEAEAEHEVDGELPEAGAECEVGGELPDEEAEHKMSGELPNEEVDQLHPEVTKMDSADRQRLLDEEEETLMGEEEKKASLHEKDRRTDMLRERME